MKTLFILMNHEMLPIQYENAQKTLHVSQTITLSDAKWSQISPEVDTIQPFLEHYKEQLHMCAKVDDYLLVQGDFGATYHMIRFARSLGLIPIYATTKRHATQEVVDGTIITKREFIHVRFREYEEA